MEADRLIAQAKRILADADDPDRTIGALVEARELTRTFSGEKSAFYRTLQEIDHKWSNDYIARFVREALDGFIRYVENGLLESVSIQRQARIDVVSDILEQAQILLDTKDVHPAAPAVLTGAVLEEFLRNWAEEAGLKLGNRKPSIDAYTGCLREADLITKQDAKDITSWGGIRNHAAHGEWDEVGDKHRVRLMLEGINLFMRRYSH
jgi:hypothetical protein